MKHDGRGGDSDHDNKDDYDPIQHKGGILITDGSLWFITSLFLRVYNKVGGEGLLAR